MMPKGQLLSKWFICSLFEETVAYDLCMHAWQDSALRLWNLKTKVCVLIMNGDGGHRNEVLSIVSAAF